MGGGVEAGKGESPFGIVERVGLMQNGRQDGIGRGKYGPL